MQSNRRASIQIDTTQIPEHFRIEMLSIIYDETVAYFQLPGVKEKFEQWKREKAAAGAGRRTAGG